MNSLFAGEDRDGWDEEAHSHFRSFPLASNLDVWSLSQNLFLGMGSSRCKDAQHTTDAKSLEDLLLVSHSCITTLFYCPENYKIWTCDFYVFTNNLAPIFAINYCDKEKNWVYVLIIFSLAFIKLE